MSAETDTRFSKTENSDIAGAGFKQMGPNQFQLVHVLGYAMQSLIGRIVMNKLQSVLLAVK